MSYLNLNKEKAQAVANELNTLLADYHLYYQKLRNFHWNIVGSYFFELHEKFEEMYNDAQVRIDEIAERVLTLRYTPTSNFSDYLEMAHVKESPSDLEDKEMMKTLLEDHGKLLKQMAKVMDAADKAEDEGTLDLIGGYIADLEKTSWMLDAWTMKKTEKHKVL
ncbi:MAG TPA: DNA starvation/stationary phase protection protein [Flavobacteriaceae bacterium]|nr:DNA starvation/stationary phase protection protein [Flavobacteriaceae bacterium]